MKSMVSLTLALLQEVGQQAGITTTRDAEYIRSRVEREGFSFLTITLPKFCTDFESALDLGFIGHHHFTGFGRVKSGERPKFLGGFLQELFPLGNLDVNLEPGRASILVYGVRQVCQLMKKVELECSPSRIDRAYQEYVELDHGIQDIAADVMSEFKGIADWLFSEYYSKVEGHLFDDWRPYFSGGALATRESFNGRFSSRIWTERLQEVLPHWDALSFSYRDEIDNPVHILTQDEEIPSRVTHVPKTLKTPRIIAMEPVWNQCVQQTILHEMESCLSKPEFLDLNLGFGWTSQDFNRYLAQVGSHKGNLATIDLSSASDSVSNQLVVHGLLGRAPYLRELSQASRSVKANVRGEIISLKKFASMGSSLTFPFESMVFYTAAHMAWKRTYGHLPKTALTPFQGVRVYGDDIIVPIRVVPSLLEVLSDLGLKVNSNKSFWTGKFRESCGADWYDGRGVTPIRLPVPIPEKTPSPDIIRRLIEFQNNLFSNGLLETAAYIETYLHRYQFIPYAPPGTSGHAFNSYDSSLFKTRFNRDTYRLEYKVLKSKEVKPLDELEGWGAMIKWTMPHDKRDADHLKRDGRSQCVSLNTGWGI